MTFFEEPIRRGRVIIEHGTANQVVCVGRGMITDIQRMMARLKRDHRMWQRRKSRPCPVETVPELVA